MFEMGIGTLIIYTGIVIGVTQYVVKNYQKGDVKLAIKEAKAEIKAWFTDDFFGTQDK